MNARRTSPQSVKSQFDALQKGFERMSVRRIFLSIRLTRLIEVKVSAIFE